MQQFNRFSRYKLKKEAEDLVLDASEDFVELAMVRLKQLSVDRGDSKIQLCDIRRWVGGLVCLTEVDLSSCTICKILLGLRVELALNTGT